MRATLLLLAGCQISGAYAQPDYSQAATQTPATNNSCTYGGGQACDTCASALDCAYGSLCVGVSMTADGICAPSCTHDCDCPTDFACTPVGVTSPTSVCLPKGGVCAPTCACNQDCTAANTACDGAYCRPICATDADCTTPGFVCGDELVCGPAKTPGTACE